MNFTIRKAYSFFNEAFKFMTLKQDAKQSKNQDHEDNSTEPCHKQQRTSEDTIAVSPQTYIKHPTPEIRPKLRSQKSFSRRLSSFSSRHVFTTSSSRRTSSATIYSEGNDATLKSNCVTLRGRSYFGTYSL